MTLPTAANAALWLIAVSQTDSIVVTNALLLIIIIVTVQQCISWIVAEQWTAEDEDEAGGYAAARRGVARGVAARRVPSPHAWPTRSWPHHRPCPRLQHNILFSHVSLQSGLFITRRVNSLNINFCKLHFNLIKYVLICLIIITRGCPNYWKEFPNSFHWNEMKQWNETCSLQKILNKYCNNDFYFQVTNLIIVYGKLHWQQLQVRRPVATTKETHLY